MNKQNTLIAYIGFMYFLGGFALQASQLDPGAQLFKAISSKDLEMVKHVVEQGAKVDYIPRSIHGPPLVLAITEGNIPIIEYLLSQGALVDRRSYNGQTPLMIALARSTPATAKILLEHQAHVNAQDLRGQTPLMYAARNREIPSVDSTKALITQGAQVNTQDDEGLTALMHAVKAGNTDIVKYLLTLGTLNVNTKTKNEKTALTLAKEKFIETKDPRYQEIGRMLIKRLGLIGPEGKLSKTGLLQTGLPAEILESISTFMLEK